VGGKGEELQRRLQARRADKHGSSWLVDWWNHLAYLSDRGPVVFFVSYFYVFKPLTTLPPSPPATAGGRLQCAVAAALAEAALLFHDKVTDGSLDPDVVGTAPQCMAAYPFLFNSCRIPAVSADSVAVHHVPPPGHLLIARRGRFYKVHTHLPCGRRASRVELARAMLAVVAAADAAGPAEVPIGALTGTGRSDWAAARALLCESAVNRASLLAVEQAALVVCLDHIDPPGSEGGEGAVGGDADGDGEANARARIMWHGDGVNRFYDKTLQLIVLVDGRAGERRAGPVRKSRAPPRRGGGT
jgi:carnitine O-acetyltransferase